MVLFILFKEYFCKQVDLLDRGSTLIMRFGQGVFSFSGFGDISKDSLRSRERSERRLEVLVLLGEVCSASSSTEGRKGEGTLCFLETSE